MHHHRCSMALVIIWTTFCDAKNMLDGIAPHANSMLQQRVKDCGEHWQIKPDDPGFWRGDHVFPANPGRCSQCPTEAENIACLDARTTYFMECNVTVVLPHKSASSMLLGQFENICGKPTLQVGGHFGGDHLQDRISEPSGTANGRRLAGPPSTSNCGSNFEHPSRHAKSNGSFVVFFLRDPYERAIGMYNMLGAPKEDSGIGVYLNTTDMERIHKATSLLGKNEPLAESDIQWRFSKWLAWLQSRPRLKGNEVHFSPQAWYLGVGCSRGPMHVDLVGRSEWYTAAFDEIGRHVPQFREKHEAFLSLGKSLPPWYTRMHDVRGIWSMMPCQLNNEIEARIRNAFDVDYECFDERATRMHNILDNKSTSSEEGSVLPVPPSKLPAATAVAALEAKLEESNARLRAQELKLSELGGLVAELSGKA